MWQYISAACQSHGSSPMFTWLGSAGRIELSGTTFLNAVSKAGNFLADGLEVEPEQEVFVGLGNHWQAPVWKTAVIAIGAVVSDLPAAVNIVDPAGTEQATQTIAVVSLDPFGMPAKDLPSHVINASAEVRGFGDYFSPRTPTTAATQLTSWGVNVQQAQEVVERTLNDCGVVGGETLALEHLIGLRSLFMWQCLVPILNRNCMVLLDREYDQSQVAEQEHVSQFITDN